MKNLLLFIKSFFICLHLPSNLTIISKDKLIKEDNLFQTWGCTCDCHKCGATNIQHTFTFTKRNFWGPFT